MQGEHIFPLSEAIDLASGDVRPSTLTLEGSKAELHIALQVLETHPLLAAAERLPLSKNGGQDKAR